MKDKSKLGNLPANQQAALEQWLFDDSPALEYEQARERLWQDFSVRTSLRALCEWRQKRAQERSLAKIAASSQASRAVVQKFSENPSHAFNALMEMIGQAAFEIQMDGKALSLDTLKDLAEVAALGLKARKDTKDLELRERDQVLKENKYRDLVAEKKSVIEATTNAALKTGGISKETAKQINETLKLF